LFYPGSTVKSAMQKDDAFLLDVRRALNKRLNAMWWLGQSGFLFTHQGRAFILDPYLSDSLTNKYAKTDKPHVRTTERVIDPAALGSIGALDFITSSHNHTDHFDPETLQPLLAADPNTRLVIPGANRKVSTERLPGFADRFVDLDDGAVAQIAGVEISGVASAHPTVERDEGGHCLFLGYILRFGAFTVYHSGDTLLHDGLVPSLKKFAADLALLPINGDLPERRVAGNLDGVQAAALAKAIGARCVVPCHYDMFEFNTAGTDPFMAEAQRLGQAFQILRNGERLDLASI
jgi:L-ascorbate metabolism protein UlaG (beta-lactamase superfamily)